MKKILLFAIIAAICAGCDNQPAQPADQLIIGSWQVYKQKVTGLYYNAAGEPVNGTRELPIFDDIIYTFLTDSTMLYTVNGATYTDVKRYTMTKQDNGTWLLVVKGLYETVPSTGGASEASGRSPITIYKISKDKMEWEYVAYGGDEGPDTYYQYLKRVDLAL